MRKLLNNPWFVAVMAIVALAVVAQVLFFNGEKLGLPGFNAPDASASAEATSDDSTRGTAWSMVKKIPMPVFSRDPFAIKVKVVEGAEKVVEPDLVDSVHLTAVWTQGGQTLVLINDRIFQGGDEIGRLKIESATQEGVWLSHWKGRDFVSIGGNFTLNTPASKFIRAVSSL